MAEEGTEKQSAFTNLVCSHYSSFAMTLAHLHETKSGRTYSR